MIRKIIPYLLTLIIGIVGGAAAANWAGQPNDLWLLATSILFLFGLILMVWRRAKG